MEKILSKEERERIDALLEKHQPKEKEMEKEKTVLSEKGKKITVKSEVASSSKVPFKQCPMEMMGEASKRKFEVIGTDDKMEYEELDTAAEEEEVGKLNEEERDFPRIQRILYNTS